MTPWTLPGGLPVILSNTIKGTPASESYMATESTAQDPRFRDRAELLDFLLEVAEATSLTLNLDELMENIGKIVQEVVPWEVFAILLYSEKMQGLRVRYSVGHREEMTRHLVVPLTEGITGAAASTLEPVLVGDVRGDSRYICTVDAVRTELAVPMIARGRLVGVIDLQSARLNAYTDEDSTLVQLIASRVAASIDNARLYRRTVRQNHTLRALTRIAQSFSSTLDLDELLGKIAAAVRKMIPYDAFSILLLDSDQGILRRRFSLRYDERVQLDSIPLGRGITGAAVEHREPVRVEDTRGDSRYIESTPGIRSEVAVPLLVPDRVVGVMDLESERIGNFTEEHVRLLNLLAPLIANSMENARLYEEISQREQRAAENLRAARHVQSALLLRKPPEIDNLEIATLSRAAQEISGDLYDFFENGGDIDIIAFGDVSGKGAAAALYGALVAGLLRSLAPRRPSPGILMKSLNAALGERKIHATYVTLLLLFWEPQMRILTMSNGGMFPPIICREGKVLKQKVEGIPLGLLDDRIYDEVTFSSQPGDVLLLYSDGIYDQVNPEGIEYGRRRLYDIMEQKWRDSPSEIADAVFADVERHMAGAGITDDQTVVVFKVK